MKKRVLLVNKFYYRRGGDCVYTLALERLLRSHGHDVAVWSMRHPCNGPSQYEGIFAPEVRFDGSLSSRFKAAARTLGYAGVRRAFAAMLDVFRPDVVHLNNIHSYISPTVALMAHRRGIKVVWTLHDYKLLCPSYLCLYRGEVCEGCFSDKTAVMRRRCMKNSAAAGALAWAEAVRWNRRRLTESVDTFICPSRFMRDKMLQGGYPADKLTVMANFVSAETCETLASCPPDEHGDCYCYVGRLSPEKGVDRLLEVAAGLPYKLQVIGDGPSGDALRQRYGSCANIKFTGNCDTPEVMSRLSRARFSIIPSVCYENCPLGVIESLCAGTPVAGALIGGIPELIDDGDGLCFTAADAVDMSRAVHEAFSRRWDYEGIRSRAGERFSAEKYYGSLTDIYAL